MINLNALRKAAKSGDAIAAAVAGDYQRHHQYQRAVHLNQRLQQGRQLLPAAFERIGLESMAMGSAICAAMSSTPAMHEFRGRGGAGGEVAVHMGKGKERLD